MALRAKEVENAKGKGDRYELPDGGGLYLVVQPSGARTWAFRYRYHGKPRKLTIGAFPLIPLADKKDESGRILVKGARTLAGQAREAVEAGKDPAADKQREAGSSGNSLKAICENYLKWDGDNLRSKPLIESALKRLVYPELGEREIDTIRRSEISKLLNDIADDRGPVMADRVLAYLRRIFNWHAVQSDSFNSPIVRGMARTKPKQRERKRVLTDDEIKIIWKTAKKTAGPFDNFVRFLLLTMTRRNEAARMPDTELSGDDWIIPAARYKTKVDHLIPLSQQARDLLGSVTRFKDVPYFFTTGDKPIRGFHKFKAEFDEAVTAELRKADPEAKPLENWTLHDLRRTGRSLMSRVGINADIAERCLGHVIGGVRGVYDRHAFHAEKKQAFEALAMLLDRIVNAKPDNVVQMRA